MSVTAFGRFQSGNPFTPMVSGDVNGDGYNNDRAFIYNPATTTNPTLAAAMQNLLTSAPSSVRDCLKKQLGTIAGKNSCEGPWSTSLSLRIALVSQALKIPDRATISLGIANPLTGVDALVHGSNNLHGWGAPSFVDPTLLYVRGFDPTSQKYIYDVNPRFGAEPPGERAQPRADAAHARRAVRHRSGARASGSLPAPAHGPQRQGQQDERPADQERCTSAAIRTRSSRCCVRPIRSA